MAITLKEVAHKDIAVVGNAGSLRQCSGLEIDSHEIVIRINNYVLDESTYSFTGHRTDIWCNSFYTDIADRHEDFLHVVNPALGS